MLHTATGTGIGTGASGGRWENRGGEKLGGGQRAWQDTQTGLKDEKSRGAEQTKCEAKAAYKTAKCYGHLFARWGWVGFSERTLERENGEKL